jgi:hypothetical protein
MRERAMVDRRFDPYGRALPVWRVFRWQGSQRWMLAEFKAEADALAFARRVNEEG